MDDTFEYYDPITGPVARGWSGDLVESYRALDDLTVEVTSRRPTGFLPTGSTLFLSVGSPAAIAQYGEDFSDNHEGSGPFNYIEHTPRVSMTVERFVDYWGKVPNVDQYISFPIPEQTTRVAALLNSEVDWIEVPASDAIPRMLDAGMILSAQKRAHWWPYQINMHKAPWDDVRVRKALNYAIDRETLCRDILNGICVPATGVTYPGHPHFGNPEELYSYNPEKAKALLAEAGVELPVKFHLLTSTSGSGQMSPIIMNEFIQRNVAESGFEMTMEFVEWNTFQERTWVRLAPEDGDKPGNYQFIGDNAHFDAFNNSFGTDWPTLWAAYFRSARATAANRSAFANTMGYASEEMDSWLDKAERCFTTACQDEAFAHVNEIAMRDSVHIFVVHDANPKMINPRIKGYVQDQCFCVYLQDLWIVDD